MTVYEPTFKVDFNYKTPPESLALENILWTVRLSGGDFGGIEVTDLNGSGPYRYKVNHLHMHGPAEHRIEGVQYDLEIHIVHELVGGPQGQPEEEWKAYNETLAVIGFFFEKAEKSHPFIEKMRPLDFGPISDINFNELFGTLASEVENLPLLSGDQRQFYHYKGSLTNPPCADVVNWILYKKVLPISEEHLAAFRSVWFPNLGGHGNFRECQPLCGRKIVRNFEHFEESDHHKKDKACVHHNIELNEKLVHHP